MSRGENERNCRSVINVVDDFTVTLLETKSGPKNYSFDSCFHAKTGQDQVFEDVKRLIQSAIDGYNVCIFAYGQTGSGKTYTMYGNKENPGITPRAVDEIFCLASQMEEHYEVEISLYMIELYLDTLVDLLAPKDFRKAPTHLEIKEDPNGMIYLQGVSVRIQGFSVFDSLLFLF
jgi:hypothetical protein